MCFLDAGGGVSPSNMGEVQTVAPSELHLALELHELPRGERWCVSLKMGEIQTVAPSELHMLPRGGRWCDK